MEQTEATKRGATHQGGHDQGWPQGCFRFVLGVLRLSVPRVASKNWLLELPAWSYNTGPTMSELNGFSISVDLFDFCFVVPLCFFLSLFPSFFIALCLVSGEGVE